MWPAKAFYPARDLLLSSGPRPFPFSMIDMKQQIAEMILTLFFEFLAKTLFVFILVFAVNSTKKRPEFWAKTFLFWSARMVAARWNLVRTECGPLVQKVAEPCHSLKPVGEVWLRLNVPGYWLLSFA